MKFIIKQAITLVVSVALLSSSIAASGAIRGGGGGGGGRFLSTISVTTGERAGEYCARGDAGQQCTVDGKVKTNGQIRYGHSATNRFSNWKDILGNKPFTCQQKWKNDNVGFAMDPAYKQQKNCYWREKPSDIETTANTFIKECATDGNSCACVGGQARYGHDANGNKAGDRWTNWIDVRAGAPGVFDDGSTNCVKSSFGNFDPAEGVRKVCECRQTPKEIGTEYDLSYYP